MSEAGESVAGTTAIPEGAPHNAGGDLAARARAALGVDAGEEKKSDFLDFMKDLDLGKLLSGGVVGLLGFFFGGAMIKSVAGDGLFGTMLSAALAIPMAMMGGNQFGDTFNRWLGHAPSKDAPEAGDRNQLQYPGAMPNPVVGLGAARFTPKELNAMLKEAGAEGSRLGAPSPGMLSGAQLNAALATYAPQSRNLAILPLPGRAVQIMR